MSNHPTEGSVSCQLDWCRYTALWDLEALELYAQDKPLELAELAARLALMNTGVFRPVDGEKSSRLNYNRARPLGAGVIFWHDTKPEQRIMVELTGSDLATMRQSMIADEELVTYLIERQHRVTRLDCALDLYTDGDVMELKQQFEDNRLQTRVKDCTVVEKGTLGTGRTGITVYFGNPSSARRLRVYNKGLQMDTTYPWIRLEIVLRDEAAQAALSTIHRHGIDVGTRSLIKAHVNAPYCDWFQLAMTGKIVRTEPEQRVETDVDKWLKDDIAPLLAKRLQVNAEQDNYELFERFVAVLETITETTLNQRPKVKHT